MPRSEAQNIKQFNIYKSYAQKIPCLSVLQIFASAKCAFQSKF